jgi:hypothetical protein
MGVVQENANVKFGFLPISQNPNAHGVYYINKKGQLLFKRFDSFVLTVTKGTGTDNQPQFYNLNASTTVGEKYLIVGLMLDYCLFDAFQDAGQLTDDIKPIELYLMRSSNINFVVPDNEYRLEYSPFTLSFVK